MSRRGADHQFDWEEVPPSVAVVEVVSAATNREPTSLPPLRDAVDTDALDALCAGESAATSSTAVSFTYAEHAVTVRGNGTVSIEPIDAERTL
ncbi:HalOD1 output domain-containing protein [Halobellus sp. GM3]|uniref:HalOD1 output domain-containing protein n=1 Tax=Halobellus sp. GM3 TaxID=3458410 RepID=UPI00403DFD45